MEKFMEKFIEFAFAFVLTGIAAVVWIVAIIMAFQLYDLLS